MKVLLSSLGHSPAVVTETIDALKRKGIEIEKVVTLGTASDKIIRTENLFKKYLPICYSGMIYEHFSTEEPEIEDENQSMEFLGIVSEQLLQHQDNEVYVSLAGGRKTMAAMMERAVLFYGHSVRGLCHVIVDIESEADIDDIIYEWDDGSETGIEEVKKQLHPSEQKVQLVELPPICLSPLLNTLYQISSREVDVDLSKIEVLKSLGFINDEYNLTDSGNNLIKSYNEANGRLYNIWSHRYEEQIVNYELEHDFKGYEDCGSGRKKKFNGIEREIDVLLIKKESSKIHFLIGECKLRDSKRLSAIRKKEIKRFAETISLFYKKTKKIFSSKKIDIKARFYTNHPIFADSSVVMACTLKLSDGPGCRIESMEACLTGYSLYKKINEKLDDYRNSQRPIVLSESTVKWKRQKDWKIQCIKKIDTNFVLN